MTLNGSLRPTEINNKWFLNHNMTQLTIYEKNNFKTNEILENNVNCLQTTGNCDTLIITNFSKLWIGEVIKQSQENNSINIHVFVLTGYEPPLRVICPSDKQYACQYNATTNSVSVRENKIVSLGENINREF